MHLRRKPDSTRESKTLVSSLFDCAVTVLTKRIKRAGVRSVPLGRMRQAMHWRALVCIPKKRLRTRHLPPTPVISSLPRTHSPQVSAGTTHTNSAWAVRSP